jgi:hypothetical protein
MSGVAAAAPLQPADCLTRVLRTPAAAATVRPEVPAEALIDAALQEESLLPVGWTLRAAGAIQEWPAAFANAFHAAERQAVAVECARHSDLVDVLAALTAEGVRAVPFKGAALAHTHYPAPHLRPRLDTDLLISADDAPAVHRVFAGRGYIRDPEVAGRLVTYQFHYYKRESFGLTHAYDVHRKISNLQSLADRLTFDELWGGRVAIPALGRSAAVPNAVHALVLALVHRAGHHPGSRRLLWLYDLHLIASRLTDDERRAFLALAEARGLGAVAREGLSAAYDRFETPALSSLVHELSETCTPRDRAVPMSAAWTLFNVLRSDLRALPRWRDRARLLGEHLFPSPSYIRGRYGVGSNALVPPLYVWRIITGFPKWFASRTTQDSNAEPGPKC